MASNRLRFIVTMITFQKFRKYFDDSRKNTIASNKRIYSIEFEFSYTTNTVNWRMQSIVSQSIDCFYLSANN